MVQKKSALLMMRDCSFGCVLANNQLCAFIGARRYLTGKLCDRYQATLPAVPPSVTRLQQQAAAEGHRTRRRGTCPDEAAVPRGPVTLEERMRFLVGQSMYSFPHAVCCEACGTMVWRTGVLPDDQVDAFIEEARRLTPTNVAFNQEHCLTLLHHNNYDIKHTLRIIRHAAFFHSQAASFPPGTQ
eukprot:TRINITY_DN3073_c0_g1_i1.p1 TRINITY_DN3073_c0_g1~~TRINITY_DN3073_c0_g1_i1.p1  ORF type:complete len:185 (+),score=48.65 TRINITY_DN3073_c0_g1_i1:275-829(+)